MENYSVPSVVTSLPTDRGIPGSISGPVVGFFSSGEISHGLCGFGFSVPHCPSSISCPVLSPEEAPALWEHLFVPFFTSLLYHLSRCRGLTFIWITFKNVEIIGGFSLSSGQQSASIRRGSSTVFVFLNSSIVTQPMLHNYSNKKKRKVCMKKCRIA